MNTEHHTFGGIDVEVHWKSIKNLHVGVYPPDGRVRVAAPTAVSLDAIRRAVLLRMAWVRRQQARFLAQERQSPRLYQSGETHYVWGRPLRLEIVEWDRRNHKIAVLGNDRLSMSIPSNSSSDQRARWMAAWRRAELRMISAPKVQKWSAVLDVKPSNWGIRDMRTKWGSCNAAKGIIWLNVELSAKPVIAIDYVILHELAHLISDRHDDQFVALLDQHMPQWRTIRTDLNLFPLAAWDTQSPTQTCLKSK